METGHISENLQVMACSIKWFELFFSKMLKLDEKESLDPKWVILSDLVKFSTLACLTCFHGSITVCSFLKAILVRFWCLTTHFEAYDLLHKYMEQFCHYGAYKAPKNGKTCPKIANVGNFWIHFAIFRCFRGPLVAIWAQSLVEEVLSFKMSTQTSKLDKN